MLAPSGDTLRKKRRYSAVIEMRPRKGLKGVMATYPRRATGLSIQVRARPLLGVASYTIWG